MFANRVVCGCIAAIWLTALRAGTPTTIELPFDDRPVVRLTAEQMFDQPGFPAAAVFDAEFKLIAYAEGDRAVAAVAAALEEDTAQGRSPARLRDANPQAFEHLLAGASDGQIDEIRRDVARHRRTLVFLDLAGTRCPPCLRERAVLQAMQPDHVLIIRRVYVGDASPPSGFSSVTAPAPGYSVMPERAPAHENEERHE